MSYARQYGDLSLATGAMSPHGRLTAIGGAGEDVMGIVTSRPVVFASAAAMAWHGYKRTGSVIWALLYSALGPIGLPIAMAQGFGRPKLKSNPGRRGTTARGRAIRGHRRRRAKHKLRKGAYGPVYRSRKKGDTVPYARALPFRRGYSRVAGRIATKRIATQKMGS